jgi:Ni/Fe-hydrogenase subunit HybB-like protein
MKSAAVLRTRVSRGTIVLAILGAIGLGLIACRFWYGLGEVTHLSDGYPWGFWIGLDILVGIALAAGGFVMAGLVHIFGGHRFHPLARPAILTALLGYLLFIFALMVDLGRPWNIWRALFSWNHYSPMFEVAWCVMFYTFVLCLEFLPAVFERFGLSRLHRLWHATVPFVIMVVLGLFTFAMSASAGWAIAIVAILAGWELLMRLGVMARDRQMPVLLIMAGIMLSTLHQSSLGTLFLITDKLNPLWYTPVLPLLFFLSAVMVGPAMVIVEAMISARVRRRDPELPLLAALGQGMPYLLGLYLVVRVGDIIARGVVGAMNASLVSGWWWLEIGLVLAALALFAAPDVVRHPRWLLTAAVATVGALVVQRTGVAIVGINVPEYAPYVPAVSEVLVTVGIVALGLLAFRLATAFLPIYESDEHAASAAAHGRARQPATAQVYAHAGRPGDPLTSGAGGG